MANITIEEFLILSKTKHMINYDYSLIEFPIKKTDVLQIIDPDFGLFTMAAHRFLKGITHVKRKSTETGRKNGKGIDHFLKKSKLAHGDLYDYSEVLYIDAKTKVKIIDPEYGAFFQTPNAHVNGQGNPLRGRNSASDKRKMTTDLFLKNAIDKHGRLYDYSRMRFINNDTKILIIDPVYGEFWQSPYEHTHSCGHPNRSPSKQSHVDHIIPISILHSRSIAKISGDHWVNERPLHKFLSSDINLQKIPKIENLSKGDFITINGKRVSAKDVRNNYEIIDYLIRTLLNYDPTEIIQADKEFLSNFFFK